MFKIGDIIDYSFYKNLEVVDIDDIHYTLKDTKGNTRRIYISLIDKYGRKKDINEES